MSFLIVAMPLIVLADPPGIGNDDVDDVPVDGGISLLIAAGVGYGIKRKIQQSASKEKDTTSFNQ